MIEGKAADGTSGVRSDAGEGFEGVGVGGEGAVEVSEEGLCGFLEVSDAVVVAESFPGAEDFCFGRSGNGFDIGEFGEEFLEATVGDDRGDGGLL